MAGGFHTIILTEDNQVFSWGSGAYGELGCGDLQPSNKPKQIQLPNETTLTPDQNDFFSENKSIVVKQIKAGGHHSILMSNKGMLYTFGYGAHGQLGHRSTSNALVPTLVRDMAGKPVKEIAAGWNHTLVLSQAGDLYACGYNKHGQL